MDNNSKYSQTSNNPTFIQFPASMLKDAAKKHRDEDITLEELWFLCLGHWRWFFISVLVCLSAATLYILRTPKSYTRMMSVLIKSDQQKDYNGAMGDFADIGLIQGTRNVDNEIIAMTSPSVAFAVAQEMDLTTSYKKPGFFKNTTLYDTTLPIRVVFCDLKSSTSASFKIKLETDGSYQLSKFKCNEIGESFSQVFEGKLSADTVTTPLGRLLIMPSSYFSSLTEATTILVGKTPLKYVIADILDKLQARIDDNRSTVVKLFYTDVNPLRAENILSCLIDNYNRNWIYDKNQIATSTSHFINDRLSVIEKELGNVDSDISQFQSENLIPDLKVANSIYLERASSANQTILQLNAQLYIAQSLRKYAMDPTHEYELLPVNSGVEGFDIASQIDKFNELILQREVLKKNSGVNNPVMQEMEKSILEMRNSFIRSIDNQITALKAQIKAFNRSQAHSNAQMAINPDRSKYLLSAQRQQMVKEQLYLYLLEKREENELTQAFTAYNTRIVNPPFGGDAPTAPKSRQILIIAFIFGLLVPFVYIHLREVFTTVVRGRKDIQNMNVPFAGEIPENPKKPKSKKERYQAKYQLQIRPDSRNILNEAFRIVRTNLMYVAGPKSENPAKVIMVTSLNPDSGKTFIAMNLSATYAIAGQKVLVIDLDFRNSSASRFVGRPKEGITAFLSGVVEDWHELVKPVPDCNNFFVLPAGHSVANPTDLLQGSRLATILERVLQEYDFIMLDCPPCEVVADASLICQYADLTLFVIRCGLFQRAMRKNVEQLYLDHKFPRFNIILNGSESATSRYGYKRYGYGYGYGYGNYYSYYNVN